MGIVSKIIGRGKGGDSDEEEIEGVDLSALDNLDDEIGGAIDRGLGETTETAQTVADTSPSEEGPGMFFSLDDPEPAAPDPMGVEAVLASNQDNSDWYGPQNAASPGGEERQAHPMMREDGHLPTLARIEGWEEPEEYLNEIELIDGATMVTVPEVADPGELFRSAFANREENSAKQAPPPPITGLEAHTGSGSDPWSEAEPASMAAPAPPPPPQAAQGSAVPDAYRVYQDEIARARRKDRARKALSSIISLITGGVGVGMAARGRGNAAALAGLAGKVAQNAVPAPVREAQAQRDFAMRRQVDADGRAIQTQDRRDRIADRVAVDGLTERERHNRAMEETSARNAASLEARRDVQNEGVEALNQSRRVQDMDRETARAFNTGEGDPELVQRLRDQEIQYLRMAWDQLPDDDRSAAWESAMERAELGEMAPLDIQRAARAMERAGSTRVRGRRRGGGGSGGGARGTVRSALAEQLAARQIGLGAGPVNPATGERMGLADATAYYTAAYRDPADLRRELGRLGRSEVNDAIADADEFAVIEIPGLTVFNDETAGRVTNTQRERLQTNQGNYTRMIASLDEIITWRLRNPNGTTDRNSRGELQSSIDDIVSGYSGMQGAGALGEAEGQRYVRTIGEPWNPDMNDGATIGRLVGVRNSMARMYSSRYESFGYRPDIPPLPSGARSTLAPRSGNRSPAPRATPGRLAPRPAPAQPAAPSNRVTVRINGQERTISRARLERLQAAAERQGQSIEVVN